MQTYYLYSTWRKANYKKHQLTNLLTNLVGKADVLLSKRSDHPGEGVAFFQAFVTMSLEPTSKSTFPKAVTRVQHKTPLAIESQRSISCNKPTHYCSREDFEAVEINGKTTQVKTIEIEERKYRGTNLKLMYHDGQVLGRGFKENSFVHKQIKDDNRLSYFVLDFESAINNGGKPPRQRLERKPHNFQITRKFDVRTLWWATKNSIVKDDKVFAKIEAFEKIESFEVVKNYVWVTGELKEAQANSRRESCTFALAVYNRWSRAQLLWEPMPSAHPYYSVSLARVKSQTDLLIYHDLKNLHMWLLSGDKTSAPFRVMEQKARPQIGPQAPVAKTPIIFSFFYLKGRKLVKICLDWTSK